MGYVAVKGGTFAIEESIKRLRYERLKKGVVPECAKIEGGMRVLIDQVMSESGLYSETLAALAVKQAEGSPEEAVFLLKAYRSTLPRNHYSCIVNSEGMLVERRISASFKDIPGGQILGAACDYTLRLMDFALQDETDEDAVRWLNLFNDEERGIGGQGPDLRHLPKVLNVLRSEGLIPPCEDNDCEPDDVSQESVQFPTSRSQRLQILTGGQTGAVTSLGYAALRSFGALHPTVGELRVGNVPVYVGSLLSVGHTEEDSYYIGEIKVTEVETLFPITVQKENGRKEIEFGIGYGMCCGQNETKAIAMSILDRCLESGSTGHPVNDEEFVLLHINSVEASGFISHLKLPHYVTFRSELDSVRKTRKGMSTVGEDEGETG